MGNVTDFPNGNQRLAHNGLEEKTTLCKGLYLRCDNGNDSTNPKYNQYYRVFVDS